MAVTSTRPIYVDGVRLDTLAWNVERIDRAMAARRSSDTDVPNLDGLIPGFSDSLEATTFGLQLWLRGSDLSGAVPAVGAQTTLRQNLDELLHLFSKRHALLEVLEQTDGSARMVNEATNPALLNDATGWTYWAGSSGTTTMSGARVVGGGPTADAPNFYRATFTAIGTNLVSIGVNLNGMRVATRAGRTFYAMAWARYNRAQRVATSIELNSAMIGGAFVSSTLGTPVDLAANTWTLLPAQALTPTVDGQSIHLNVYLTSGGVYSAPLVGDTLDVSLAVFSFDVAPTAGFSGATPDDATYDYAWEGAAGASRSIRTPWSMRRALCKVTDSIAPDLNSPGTTASMAVSLVVPSGMWEDAVAQDQTLAAPNSGNTPIVPLQGTVERVNDAIFLVEGPAVLPRITDQATGAWVQLNRTLAAGDFWRFNSATWSSRYGTGLSLGSADTAGTDGAGDTSTGGPSRPYGLPLVPVREDTSGVRKVRAYLTAASGIVNGTTKLSTRTRRKFAA